MTEAGMAEMSESRDDHAVGSPCRGGQTMAQPSIHRRTRSRWLLANLLLAAAILPMTSCAPGGDLPYLQSARPSVYQLGPDDQIRVIVYGEDQLSDDYRVSDNGTIAMPLLGTVKVAGLTPEQLSSRITSELQTRNLLKNSSVSTEIVAFRPIFVLGEVAHPGQYPYQPNMTVLTAVALAGGFTYRAVEDYAAVTRQAEGHAEEGRLRPNDYVEPRDVIRVLERHF
jgi:polysaccharide export outer membrane protein